MKGFFKFLIVIVILGTIVGGYFGFNYIKEQKRLDEVKKGWYVEITYKTPVNVRTEPNTKGSLITTVKKGEIYKVTEMNFDSNIYYWYKIELKNGKTGWIASGRKVKWLNDVNNPTDIAVPYIKYYDDVYEVNSIDEINYKHLEVVEDTDVYTITHIVYHEPESREGNDQYWILYTITDGAGKSSKKLQKIKFNITPDESQVEDFANYLG